ncbi:MAG: hypothetical protein U0R52_02220 [Solirubrobacterales bacterium]
MGDRYRRSAREYPARGCGAALVALATCALALAAAAPAGAEQAASADSSVVNGFLDAGGLHTCAVLEGGSVIEGGGVRCWGLGDDGRLGTGSADDVGDDEFPSASFTNLGSAKVRAVASGFAHSCALYADHTVRCWGLGLVGRLGYGNGNSLGAGPADMPTPVVDVGGPAVAITAGGNHTCVILTDGSVRCWGGGAHGRLGSGGTANIGDAPGEMPPPPVPLGARAVAISAGTQHTCAVLEDGTVRCWGAGLNGELGYGNTSDVGDAPGEMPPAAVNVGGSAVAVSAGFGHTCALLSDRTVHCWGDNTRGDLGYGDTSARGDDPGEMPTPAIPLGGNARAVSAGKEHTCAQVGLSVKCWGGGGSGQLGLASSSDIGDGPGEMPPAAVDLGEFEADGITAGDFHTCAVLGSGSVRCWGLATFGRLGNRSTSPNIGDTETPGSVAPVPLGGSVVTEVADASLRLDGGAPKAVVGDRRTITVAVASHGPRDATGVSVSLALPDGLRYLSGPFDPATGEVQIGTAQSSGEEIVRRIVARVTLPGPLAIGAEISSASRLDPDSTPGNGVAGEDDQASATIAAKARPDALGLEATPGRDAGGRVNFTAAGRLAVASGVADVCGGKVAVTVIAGERRVVSKRAALRLKRGECSYSAQFSLARRGRVASASALKVTAAFAGNDLALPVTARPVAVGLR